MSSVSDRNRAAFRGALLISSAVAAFAAAPASATETLASDAPLVAGDEAAADADLGETIVVTASRRREENVQDVPVAITALSAEQLERRGDYTLGQIQAQVPSLQVFSFNPRNTNINIRGLGSNVALTNDGLENGVGFYIDDVYYGRVGLSQFDLVDLENIEVLRGPQGTLFGKNTTSGVVNITSRKPSFDPELSAEATIGNYGFYQLRASGSAPIVADKLAVRLSGALTDNNGYLYNVTQNSRAQNYYNASVRGQLLFTPTENLTFRVIGDYSSQKQDHVLNLLIAFHPNFENGTTIPNNFLTRAARFPGYTPLPFTPFERNGASNSHYQANMEGYGVSGRADWDLGGVNLTSITAYRWWDWYPSNDADATPLSITTKAQQENFQRQFSQEFRAASQGNHAIDWVVGGYYFWQIVKGFGATRFGSDAALWNVPAVPALVGNAALSGYEVNSTSTPETKSLAFFGQADWHLSDALTFTGGLRYSHEKKQGAFSQFVVDGADLSGLTTAQQATAIALRNQFAPPANYSTAFTDNSLSGLATLTWKFTPDALVYATYSRGNKSGGLNLTVLPGGVSPDVAPEKVDNFELGLKSQLFDRLVTFNAAAYLTEVRQYQTAITEPVGNTSAFRQYIANIPKVRSKGFEADLTVVPSRHLRFNSSIAYADARYVTYTNAPQAPERLNISAIQDLSGERLPGVPRWSWSVGADADLPLGELGGRELQFYGHFDYSHRSHFNTSSTNSVWAEMPGFGLANARLGLKTEDGLWDVSVFAKNLFDKDYFLSLSAANTGLVTGQVGEPRTYGVTFRTRL